MRKLFAVLLLISATAYADQGVNRALQSGPGGISTPIYDHGIHGEGQIIAVLDTGLDYKNCYFVEADGNAPPFNTHRTDTFVDLTRRKVVAYDFLYSCDDFPNATGCQNPANFPTAFDTQGHGTHAAGSIAGTQGNSIVSEADGVAPGAKLIMQGAGLSASDACTSRPGIGCPVNLTPILTQAYLQGARIHSNSWGDRQGATLVVPTANYSAGAHDVDAFVYAHPDMLVVFNTGNFGNTGLPPASSLSAPGCAKNTIQVGGTRDAWGGDDHYVTPYTLIGPTRDGRIKPDLVASAYVTAGDSSSIASGYECAATNQPGTSWSSPTVAGAAALVRQYYTDGYYPSGVPTPSQRITPSAALLKATLIAAAQRAPYRPIDQGHQNDALPVPSYEQGFGFPVLNSALYFPGAAAKLHVTDVSLESGLAQGEVAVTRIHAHAGTPLKAVLVWTDPAGVARTVSDSTAELVNDLDLRVTTPDGVSTWGNDVLHPGQPDRLNNVEVVNIPSPADGIYTISVSASKIAQGTRQSYALVITGDIATPAAGRSRAARH